MAQEEKTLPQSSGRSIVCFGDSITRGYGLSATQAWPALLEALLNQHTASAWRVINAGVPGDTILQGLMRLERDVLSHHPEVVFVAFGLNDAHLARRQTDAYREQALWEMIAQPRWWQSLRRSSLAQTLRPLLRAVHRHPPPAAPVPSSEAAPRVSPPAFEQALHLLVRRLRQSLPAIRIFLITPTPITERFHAEWPPELRQRQRSLYRDYATIVRTVAATLQTGLVDAATLLAQEDLSLLVGSDGVHLTATGQARLADLAWQALAATDLVDRATALSS